MRKQPRVWHRWQQFCNREEGVQKDSLTPQCRFEVSPPPPSATKAFCICSLLLLFLRFLYHVFWVFVLIFCSNFCQSLCTATCSSTRWSTYSSPSAGWTTSWWGSCRCGAQSDCGTRIRCDHTQGPPLSRCFFFFFSFLFLALQEILGFRNYSLTTTSVFFFFPPKTKRQYDAACSSEFSVLCRWDDKNFGVSRHSVRFFFPLSFPSSEKSLRRAGGRGKEIMQYFSASYN